MSHDHNAVPPIEAPPRPKPVDIFKAHRIHHGAANDGVWITLRGDQFLVARLGAERTTKERAVFLSEHALPPGADIPPELQTEWAARAFARTVLLDVKWSTEPGTTYEETQGLRIYHDPDLADLKSAILSRALGDWTQQTLAYEASLGNLRLHSNGSTSAATSETR